MMGDLLLIIYGYSYATIHHYIMIRLYYAIALTVGLFKIIVFQLLSLHKTVVVICNECFGLAPFRIHYQTYCKIKRSKLQVCLSWCPDYCLRGKLLPVRVRVWFRVSVRIKTGGQFSSGVFVLEPFIMVLLKIWSALCFFWYKMPRKMNSVIFSQRHQNVGNEKAICSTFNNV